MVFGHERAAAASRGRRLSAAAQMMLSSLTPLTDYHFITLRLRLVCTGNLIRVAEVRELPKMFAPSHGRKSTISTAGRASLRWRGIPQFKFNKALSHTIFCNVKILSSGPIIVLT
jgi:hypothetical protein